MNVAGPAYLEIIDFIAAGTTPETVIQFKPSPEAERMVSDLIEKEKDTSCRPRKKPSSIISWSWSTF